MFGPILEIANLIESRGIMKPVQCIVNEYYKGQGIAPHIDSINFGPVIVGVSIGDPAAMTFNFGDKKFDCYLPSRSMVILSSDARYKWKHSLDKKVTCTDDCGNVITKPLNYRRISLTYRTLAN